MNDEVDTSFTVQGTVPTALGSEQAGFKSSLSNDHNGSVGITLATGSDRVIGPHTLGWCVKYNFRR